MRLALSEGQPLFTLVLPMFALSLVDFLSCGLPVPTSIFLNFCPKYHLKDTHTIFEKKPCRFKIWTGFVRQILLKLGTPSIWGFLYLPFDVLVGVTDANMPVATQWPLEHAPHLTSFVGVCVVWRSGSSLELSVLRWNLHITHHL